MAKSSEDEFNETFFRYWRPAYSYFLRYGFSEEESLELAQETFLRVYKGWESFRGEARMATWIFQIARNIALNQLRGRSTQKREGAEVSLDEVVRERVLASPDIRIHGGPLEDALSAERGRILREALENLPPQMRYCVMLRIESDLKYREIASILNTSIDTVKAHLFQARRQLREQLSDYFDVDAL
jgi:RNA polymerase sigma-70 factor (ECF subfamily)